MTLLTPLRSNLQGRQARKSVLSQFKQMDMYIYVKTWCIGVPYCTCMVSICGSCICKVQNSQDLHCCIYNWNSPLYTHILSALFRQWRPQVCLSTLAPMTLMHPWSSQSPLEKEALAVCLCWLPRFLSETQPILHAGEVHPAWEVVYPSADSLDRRVPSLFDWWNSKDWIYCA